MSVLWALIRTLSSETALTVWLVRCGLVTALAVLAFDVSDHWPRRLPAWAPRWIVQLTAVVAIMLPAVYLSYTLTLGTLDVLALGSGYRDGWLITSFMGILIGPWIALGALLRRSEAFAREQALAFQLRGSELERKALDARLKLLQAQIEPHFLFNTLANVSSLIDSDPILAKSLLERLNDWLRVALARARSEGSTLADELEMLENYLQIMKIRFGDRLCWHIEAPDEIRRQPFPPMLLQPLVENAVRHGIEPKLGGGEIGIKIRVDRNRLTIEVSDSGMGLAGCNQGTGLSNVSARLASLFGDAGHLALNSNAAGGATATITLPIPEQSA